MAQERVSITSPVGRIVAGNLYKPNTTDFDGKPLVNKTGPNIGQPRVSYFIGLAIPKAGENHWALTPWGAKIWAVGHQAFPQAAQRADFAWKIEDGDSTIPNKRNRRPCDNEGWPGHWIVRLSSGFAPKIYDIQNGGYVEVTTPDFIKPGYFVEANFNVDGNGNANNPGVYLNNQMVCFRAYGSEIQFGPNVSEAGFGQAPLPAGATLTPPPSTLPPPATAPGPGGAPYSPPPPPAATTGPAVPVYPNPAFSQVPPPAPPNPMTAGNGTGANLPAAGAIPAPPVTAYPSSPPAPTYKMTAKANGVSFEAFKAAGWNEAQLIQQGMMSL